MLTIEHRAQAAQPAPTRVILLPAAFATPADFERAGFAQALRRRQLAVDLTFAALELEHVTDRAVLSRLRAELIAPARAAGARVWLGGISLGGYVALCYAAAHPEELGGLCLFAPYLGSHIVTAEIERAGGLAAWNPGELAPEDEERRVWRFIQAHANGSPPLHLGLGRDDRFAARHRLLAAALAPQRVAVLPGGHDWPTWLALWENFLDTHFASNVHG